MSKIIEEIEIRKIENKQQLKKYLEQFDSEKKHSILEWKMNIVIIH